MCNTQKGNNKKSVKKAGLVESNYEKTVLVYKQWI